MKKKLFILFSLMLGTSTVLAQRISDFENITLEAESYIDGSDGITTENSSGGVIFPTNYNTMWDFWSSGFGISNVTDNTTPGYTNTYGNITGMGANGSENFAIVSVNTFAALDEEHQGKKVLGTYVTNSTYAYLSMLEGDSFAKKFGGESGDDEDWFLLEITGSLQGVPVEDTVKFYLADFRFADNTQDYMVDEWTWVNLLPLGKVDTLRFGLKSSDVGDWGMNTPAYFAIDELTVSDINPKAVVASGDAKIKYWASAAEVERGPLDIINNATLASYGEPSNATGVQNGTLVSLGDGGTATLTFDGVIQNLEGDDIFVFENSFAAGGNMFAELGFVEVSSDGINFFRFPAKSLTPTDTQTGSFGATDTSLVYNLAGTAPAGYGVAFDLEELEGTSGLDVMNITHVRIVDVTGTINETYASYDAYGNIVNDPFPTAFSSGGFDLDAVGVSNLYSLETAFIEEAAINFSLYPNPSVGNVAIKLTESADVSIVDLNGVEVFSAFGTGTISVNNLATGMYFVQCNSASGTFTRKLIVR